jgi:hypothetical protein
MNNIFDIITTWLEATMNENQKTFIGPATYSFHRHSSLPRLSARLNPLDRVGRPFFCS